MLLGNERKGSGLSGQRENRLDVALEIVEIQGRGGLAPLLRIAIACNQSADTRYLFYFIILQEEP